MCFSVCDAAAVEKYIVSNETFFYLSFLLPARIVWYLPSDDMMMLTSFGQDFLPSAQQTLFRMCFSASCFLSLSFWGFDDDDKNSIDK